MLFWNKKPKQNVKEEEDLKQLRSKVIRLEAEILDLATAIDIIRNKVLRKIQFKRVEPEEEEELAWQGIPKTKN